MIARRDARDARADLLDDTTALVAEHRGKESRRVAAAHRVRVRVAHARRHEPHEALAGARPLEVDLVDLERAARLPADRGSHPHGVIT